MAQYDSQLIGKTPVPLSGDLQMVDDHGGLNLLIASFQDGGFLLNLLFDFVEFFIDSSEGFFQLVHLFVLAFNNLVGFVTVRIK